MTDLAALLSSRTITAAAVAQMDPETRARLKATARERCVQDARTDLTTFARSVDIPTVPLSDDATDADATYLTAPPLAAHHELLCRAIQETVDAKSARPVNLMLLLPPGSAKSTYADVVAVPWFMATRPRARGNVILASYASDIARKQGRRARQLIQQPKFRALFPDATMRADMSAADEWALSNGNEFMAGGLLSGLTGNRAALGILDDPIRGREAAESATIRDKTWDAYVDDFCSRLIPGAPQIMILTRWHQDDPAGRILPENWAGESGLFDGRDGRKWRVICLPAIAESATDPLERKLGETLWPEWFSAEHWEPFRKNARTWASLYQQRPAPDEGTYFQREWFAERGETPPAAMHRYMTSDHARTEDGGDYTVIRVWGVDANRDIWALDGWRGQVTADKWMVEAIRLIRKHEPFCWFPENDATWGSIAPFVKSAMRDSRPIVACRIEPLSTKGDKATKARAFQAMASAGRVHLPLGEVADMMLNEYLAFPAGKHDDEVDAAAHMGRALMDAHPAILASDAYPTDWDDGWQHKGANARTGY